MKISPIINVETLLTICRNADVLIFDVSNSENAYANYQAGHLIGAVFVDLDTQLADQFMQDDAEIPQHILDFYDDKNNC